MDPLDTLCILLDEETAVSGALAATLREEQRAIVALEPEAIFASLGRRRILQDELERLAGRRRDLVRTVAREHGAEGASATELLVVLPEAVRARFLGQVRALRRTLLVARSLERQNALLVRASLRHPDELLRALRGLVPRGCDGDDAQIAAPTALVSLDRRV